MVGTAFAVFGLDGAFATGAGIALIMLFPILIILKEFVTLKET
jgi:hypothetical protein